MAIAFRNSASAGSSTNSVTISVPTGVVNGDVMIATLTGAGTGNTWAVTGGGWTSLVSDTTPAPCTAVFYRVASSEPASYTFTYTATTSLAGAIVAYSGVDNTTPINVNGTLNAQTSTLTPTANSITTTLANCIVVFVGMSSTGKTWTPPTSYTGRVTVASPASLEVSEQLFASAGATGTAQAAINTSGNTQSVLVALAPAGAPAPVNTVAPAVTGTTTVGQTLSTTNGTWTDSGGSVFTYQWQDSADGSTGWANIASATSSTYVIGSGEATKFIRCVVTDTDSTTQATAANSNVVGAIAAAPSLSTVAGKTGTSGTAVMQKAKSGWTYITGKKNTSGTAVDQKGLGGFTKIKGH